MEVVTKGAEETKKLGKKIGADLVMTGVTPVSNVFALEGDLGSGKTTFVQGLAKGLGIKQRIISPTYIIVRKYELKLKPACADRAKNSKLKTFYHVDLYRLEAGIEREIENLGLKEIWSDPKNIVVIEWAEKIRNLVPKNATWIKFEYLSDEKRRIIIKKL